MYAFLNGRSLRAGLLCLALLPAVHLLSGCSPDDETVVSPPVAGPVIVRGGLSYVLSLSADNITTDVRDSVLWYPHVAYLSITVARYSAGTGTIEITDASGVRVCFDSLNSHTEILNRKITSAMPLRLSLSLRKFTGAVTFGLQLGPTEINGMVARFALRDSTGAERSSFSPGERVDFSYSLVNLTGKTHPWAKGDSRLRCRFTVNHGDSLAKDSFYGFAWLDVPETGTLHAGDSIYVTWRGISAQSPLPSGHYAAFAEPQFILTDLGFPATREASFFISA
jgi:hypothetical protein